MRMLISGSFIIALYATLVSNHAQGSPLTFTYQGRIVKTDNTPLEYSSVSFEFRITNPSGSCVLYREQKNGIDMTNSKGIFDTPIGAGTKLFPTNPSVSLQDVFENTGTLDCEGGATYSPVNTDGRLLRVQFHDGSGWKSISPDNVIRSVPFSSYASKAASSSTLGTKTENDFLLKSSIPLCSTGDVLTSSSAGILTCTPDTGGSSGTVSGDLSGALPNPTVSRLQNIALSFSSLSTGEFLKYNGTQWINSSINQSDISGLSTTLSGYVSQSQLPSNCSTGQTLTFSSPSGTFTCSAISINGSQVSGNIAGNAAGFTGNLAGDVTGTQGTTVVNKIKGVNVSATPPTNGQILKLTGGEWTPATLTSADLPNSLDINGSINLPAASAGATTGWILQGGSPLIHTFRAASTNGQNIFVGPNAGNQTMSYASAATDASANSGVGNSALSSLTSGRNNTALGNKSLTLVTTGSQNTAVGVEVLSATITGGWNTGLGYNALKATTAGSNSAVGAYALAANTSGVDNVAVGATSMSTATTAKNNTAVGAYTLNSSGIGDSNTAVGHAAMQFKTGTNNVAVGRLAGNLTGAITDSTMVGFGAGRAQAGAAGNLLLGYQAGDAITTGSYNIILGYDLDTPTVTTSNFLNIGNLIYATNLGTGSTASTGKVGIGTTAPTETLDVVGNIKATQLCIGADCRSAWPGAGGGGTVTSVGTGTGLSGGPITGSGTISLETIAGLTASTYGTASTIPSITVDTTGRITAISTNSITGLLPAPSTNGHFLRSNGTSWSGQNILFSDIKNSVGGSAFNVGSCAANQTVAWSSLTDSFTCQNIGSLNASVITAGTLDAARLPSSVTDGLWSASGGNVHRSAGNVGIGETSPLYRLSVKSLSQETSATDMAAAFSYMYAWPTSSSATRFIGQFNGVENGNTAAITGELVGQANYVNNLASPTINKITGSWSGVKNQSGGGAVSTATGIQGEVENLSADIVTTAIGLKSSVTKSGSGAITNSYGVYVGDVQGTSRWSVYTSDANAPVYFAGNVGVGTSSPNQSLHVHKGSAISALTQYTNSTTGSATGNGSLVGVDATGNMWLWNQESLPLLFGTNNGERMRITSAGNVGIGTTSPGGKLHVASGSVLLDNNQTLSWGTSAGATRAMLYLRSDDVLRIGNDNPTDGANAISFYTEGSPNAMYITTSGNVGIGTTTPSQKLEVNGAIKTAQSATDCPSGWSCTGYYWDMSIASLYYSGLSQRSDVRLKENIHDLNDTFLERLDRLRPITYTWKDSKHGQGIKFGLIAQETEKVWPEIVSTATDEMKTKSVDYTQLISPLLKQAQETRKFNREVQSMVEALEKSNLEKDKEIADLKQRLERIEEALRKK